ncbi:MAG: aminotransferase class I/II-fold pyridoxal phosphate-dependent enzyme [Chloroflexi bacterium]|nr:aminotransferase class I/II-fold pyridoxal phosphate-dependent enzyme [Chloroflexota bacterium]
MGGFIAGSEDVIRCIKHHARSLIFSASMPSVSTAAALKVIQKEPERIARVNQTGERVWTELGQLSFNVGSSEILVVSVIIGDDVHTFFDLENVLRGGYLHQPHHRSDAASRIGLTADQLYGDPHRRAYRSCD